MPRSAVLRQVAAAEAGGQNMGWLRDLMPVAGIRSLDQLARLALDHPHWPADSSPRPRSLASILGRLDRGAELDWLRERPQAQQALADILHCRAAEIADRLGEAPPSHSELLSRIRLFDLPGGKALDLTTVSLPPTIPLLVAQPKRWEVALWPSASGSGKTLTRAWLKARSLCQTARLDENGWTDSFDSAGPLFVDSVVPVSEPLLARFRARGHVCVAASLFTGSVLTEELVETPPLAETLAPTIDYLLPLLPRGLGELRPAVETALTALLRDGVIRTLADLIGMLSVIVAHGVVDMNRSSLSKVYRRAVSERLDAALDKRDARTSMLRRNLPEILIAMHHGASDPTRPLSDARSFEDWIDTMPEEYRAGADLDWLRVQLASTELGLRRRELERAEKQLPPGAHRILSALSEAGMLQPVSPSLLALRPHFLVRLSEVLAERELLLRAPSEWGEALLDEQRRGSITRELEHRARRDPAGLVDDLFELLDEQSPALVAAFESTLIVLGHLVLQGVDLPVQLAAPLLKEMAALAFIDDQNFCRRRIGCRAVLHPLDAPGALPLALLALGELQPGYLERTRLFSAVTGTAAYSAIFELMVSWSATRKSALSQIFGLLDRLRQQVGVGTEQDSTHPLLALGVVLDEVELDVLAWPALERHLVDHDWLELLILAAESRGFENKKLGQALFRAWIEAEAPASGAVLLDHPRVMMAESATPDPTVRWLLGDPPCPLPLEQLSASVWEAYLQQRTDASDLSAERLARLPRFVLEAILNSPIALPLHSFPSFLARVPEACLARAEREMGSDPEQTAAWMRACPDTEAPMLLDVVTRLRWSDATPRVVWAVRERLWTMVEGRAPSFRRAYALLVDIEEVHRRLTSNTGVPGSS